MKLKEVWTTIVDYLNEDYDPFAETTMEEKPWEADKYKEYEVDFHGLVDHTDDEVTPEDSSLDDWHTRHKDKNLDRFCDQHPSAPQCKVFDE